MMKLEVPDDGFGIRLMKKAKGTSLDEVVARQAAELRLYNHHESAELLEDLHRLVSLQCTTMAAVTRTLQDTKDDLANVRKALGELHYAAYLIVKANSELTMAGRKCKNPSTEALYKALCSVEGHLK